MYHRKFLVGVNLPGSKKLSDSDSDSELSLCCSDKLAAKFLLAIGGHIHEQAEWNLRRCGLVKSKLMISSTICEKK